MTSSLPSRQGRTSCRSKMETNLCSFCSLLKLQQDEFKSPDTQSAYLRILFLGACVDSKCPLAQIGGVWNRDNFLISSSWDLKIQKVGYNCITSNFLGTLIRHSQSHVSVLVSHKLGCALWTELSVLVHL